MEVKFNKDEFLDMIQAYYKEKEKNVMAVCPEFKESNIEPNVKSSTAPFVEIYEAICVLGIKKNGTEKICDFKDIIDYAFLQSGYKVLNIKYNYDPNVSYISNDTFRGITVEYEHKKLNETKAKIKEKIPYPGLK